MIYGVVPHQWLTYADTELSGARTRSSPGPGSTGFLEWLPFTITKYTLRDVVVTVIYIVFFALQIARGAVAEPWQDQADRHRDLDVWPSPGEGELAMARTDANPPMPEFRDDYTLVEVDADYLAKAVKPKQFIHIDQSECIMCEGCVDICPWKCIHMVTPDAIDTADNTELPGVDPRDHVVFLIDDDVCTRCALCVDRCPTGVIIMGKVGAAERDGDPHMRDSNHGYAYGMRF